MLREVVRSSSLQSVGYDRERGTLEVEFRGGAVYRYTNVPFHVWRELQRAASKGTYFQQAVRDRYQAERVEAKGGATS